MYSETVERNDESIRCELCSRTTTNWKDMATWWAGADRWSRELYLCGACQMDAYYCDLCQSIHYHDGPPLDCSFALCPGCEQIFRAHPGYGGHCPRCLAAGYIVGESWRFLTPLSHLYCTSGG